jgi:hypothetical protein
LHNSPRVESCKHPGAFMNYFLTFLCMGNESK